MTRIREEEEDGVFNFNFLALLLSEILRSPKFSLGGPTPPSGEIFIPKASTSQYLIVFLISTFQLQQFPRFQGSQIYVREPSALCPLFAPQRKFFSTRGEYFTMSNGVFNFNFLALLLSEILGGPKFTLGGLRPWTPPSREIFVPKASISQYLIVFLISTIQRWYFPGYQGGPKFTLGALRSPEAPQRKNFDMRASTCLYLYNCKFSASQLHSRGTNGALSLQWFALKNLPKWGFGGILGGGVKIFGGNPLGMQ